MFCSQANRPWICVALAMVLSMPMSAFAQSSPSEPAAEPMAVDVTLTSGGVMHGYVVRGNGAPAADVEVSLIAPDGQQVATRSDAKGRFGYRGLAGGAYQLETEHGLVMCRAWTATAAPPRSAATLLLVHDQNVSRAQCAAPRPVNGFVGGVKRVMANPFFGVAAIVGAVVAIPVAIHNNNNKDNESS